MEPERTSVAELTNWLAQLGEKHKEHLLKGEVNKNRTSVAVEHESNTERRAGNQSNYKTSACSATSLPIASPPAPRRDTAGASQFPITVSRNQPIYREFSEQPATEGALAEEWRGPVEEQLRIVSLQKLLEPPLPSGQQRSEAFMGWNASEDYSESPAPRTKNKPGYVSTDACVHHQEENTTSKQKAKSGPSRLLPLLMCKKHRQEEDTQPDPFIRPEYFHGAPSLCPSPEAAKGMSDSSLQFKQWLESSSPECSPLPIREFGFESLVLHEDEESSSHCWNDDNDDSIVLTTPHEYDCNARMADIFDYEAAKAEPDLGSPAQVPPQNAGNTEFTKCPRIPLSPGSSTTKTESSSLSSKHSDLKVFTPPRNDISSAIEKFGGRARTGRNPSVKSLQEQLQKKWSEDRAPCYSKKIKWHARNGHYKKSVGLEYQK